MTPFLKESPAGLILSVRVQPRASKNEVVGVMGDSLKIRLTAPPVEGEANEACRKLLARFFAVPPSQIQLTAGSTSRNKLFVLCGISIEQAELVLKNAGVI